MYNKQVMCGCDSIFKVYGMAFLKLSVSPFWETATLEFGVSKKYISAEDAIFVSSGLTIFFGVINESTAIVLKTPPMRDSVF